MFYSSITLCYPTDNNRGILGTLVALAASHLVNGANCAGLPQGNGSEQIPPGPKQLAVCRGAMTRPVRCARMYFA